MAKKRKKQTTRRRGRRMGAMSLNASSPLVKYGSIAAGFFLARPINGLIDKVVMDIDPKLVAAGQVGIGALIAFRKGGGKGKLISTIAGGVMVGAGAKRAMSAFGVGGFRSVPAVNGWQNVPAVNGTRVGMLPANGSGTHIARREAMGASRSYR